MTDPECRFVYVADTLRTRFPRVYREMNAALGRVGVPMGIIRGTRDIWCRDYMPVQVAELYFVQFRYAPDYLRGRRYRRLRADGVLGPRLTGTGTCRCSDIILDGGNLIRWGSRGIVTEKVFRENPGWRRDALITELCRLLRLQEIVLIPPEPGDVTGHADGIVRFRDERTVLVTDDASLDRGFRRLLRRRLARAGLDVIEVPCRTEDVITEGMPSAVGNYLNFVRVGGLCILPVYGLPEDRAAMAVFEGALPGVLIQPIPSTSLARSGGVLHCVTWTIKTTK